MLEGLWIASMFWSIINANVNCSLFQSQKQAHTIIGINNGWHQQFVNFLALLKRIREKNGFAERSKILIGYKSEK